MVYGGIVSILIAIWIYKTAMEHKTGHTFYWVAGAVILFLLMQTKMILFNAFIIESFDTDISPEYDNAGGLNDRDNMDTAGLQSGGFGTFIGIIFELIPLVVPFFIIAVLRQMVMLRQPFSFSTLFSGLKGVFIGIKDSFKTSAPDQ